jgi:hypothetical protein
MEEGYIEEDSGIDSTILFISLFLCFQTHQMLDNGLGKADCTVFTPYQLKVQATGLKRTLEKCFKKTHLGIS